MSIHFEQSKKEAGAFLWIKSVGKDDIPPRSPVMQLHAYWTQLNKDGRLPSRREIDPVELGSAVIPWIVILDVLRSGDQLDYRYRLLGTANVNMLGCDPTGQLLSENLETVDVATIKASFDETVLTGKPVYSLAGLPHKKKFLVSVYRAFYPLAEDGVTVDALVGAAVPEDVTL